MCGRYTLTITKKVLQKRFRVDDGSDHQPRYNIGPGQEAPVIRASAGGSRCCDALLWGWASVGGKHLLINARSETLTRRATFRRWLDAYRCLVPADGFYEWTPGEGRSDRQAYRARLPDGAPFAMAGLWQPGAGGSGGAYVVITTASVGTMARIHVRSPVCLNPEDESTWLDLARSYGDVCHVLTRRPDVDVVLDPVGEAVHRAGTETPECIRRIPLMQSGALF